MCAICKCEHPQYLDHNERMRRCPSHYMGGVERMVCSICEVCEDKGWTSLINKGETKKIKNVRTGQVKWLEIGRVTIHAITV